MKLSILITSVLSVITIGVWASPERATASRRAAPSGPSGLVVHEWGTFLAMNGSDGVSLDGMYHEEHALPSFVHARSTDQLRLPMSRIKSETPVIYFYTPQVQRVQVEVGFPTGLWTQWYPQAVAVAPGLVQTGSPPRTRNGRISWDVMVRPANLKHNEPPATGSATLWNYARDVDAAYVVGSNQTRPRPAEQWERFIFYRGLGEVPLPIQVRLGEGRITASTSEGEGLQHLFILNVQDGRGAYSYAPALTQDGSLEKAVPSMTGSLPLDRFVDTISADVESRLVASGLYRKEAQAMVNTWKSSYFKTDGVRVLFVLPQSWTDRFIPMRVTPAPEQLVRVMVGRVELLDAARERRAETAIRDLASPSADVRDRAFARLRAEGRYVEPIVRRAARRSSDEQVRTLSRRLLLSDFVTELRSALTDAQTGERVSTEPVYLRAQLASLLREVGLTMEAKQHGQAALAELAQMPQPTMQDHWSRQMFRALAWAHEGAGNDAEALEWYGRFVEFGSQVAGAWRGCAVSCHQTMGPRDPSFFHDWYAGRKYGELAVQTGEALKLIAAHERVLSATPRHLASQLSLAYLYESVGHNDRAKETWLSLAR
ncbi:MAG TPA: hypothetical protein VFO21_09150 [Vicinamibacterales bacterium]|nr:hypothetical protein [Vicinamibacterales bacterium]